MTTSERGEFIEAKVTAHLLWLGDFISRPHGSRPYDLIVDRHNRLIRGQIKSGQLKPNGSLTFTIGAGGGCKARSYHGKVDMLWVYDGSSYYEIPMSDIAVGRQRVTIPARQLGEYVI